MTRFGQGVLVAAFALAMGGCSDDPQPSVPVQTSKSSMKAQLSVSFSDLHAKIKEEGIYVVNGVDGTKVCVEAQSTRNPIHPGSMDWEFHAVPCALGAKAAVSP